LGPCILEIEQYINRCLDDHPTKKETYKELTELDAIIFNEENFCWVCKVFIDRPPKELPEDNRKLFIDSIRGKRDGLKIMHQKSSLGLPYFWRVPDGSAHIFFYFVTRRTGGTVLTWTALHLQREKASRVPHFCSNISTM
jgi:hypothetical protein